MGKTFLLAPDSFKESMTAKEVCEAMEIGIKRAIPDAECIHVPMADGGEGTVQSLVDASIGCNQSIVRRTGRICCFWSAKGCYSRDGYTFG